MSDGKPFVVADVTPAINREFTRVRFHLRNGDGELFDADVPFELVGPFADLLQTLMIEIDIRRAPIWDFQTGSTRPPPYDAPAPDGQPRIPFLVGVNYVHFLPQGAVAIDVQSSKNHFLRLIFAAEQVHRLKTSLGVDLPGAWRPSS